MANKKFSNREVMDCFTNLLLKENTAAGHPNLLDVDHAYIRRLQHALGSITCIYKNPLPQLPDSVKEFFEPKNKIETPETGICICHNEPNGASSLEGYNYKGEYRYEKKIAHGDFLGNFKKPKVYYKVWVDYSAETALNIPYDTMGKTIFKRYFTIKPE